MNRFRLLIMDKQEEVGSKCDFMSWDLSHIFSSSSKPLKGTITTYLFNEFTCQYTKHNILKIFRFHRQKRAHISNYKPFYKWLGGVWASQAKNEQYFETTNSSSGFISEVACNFGQ